MSKGKLALTGRSSALFPLTLVLPGEVILCEASGAAIASFLVMAAGA